MFSAYKLGKQVLKGWFQVVLAIAAFAAIVFLDVNAIWPIVGGIVIGLIYTKFKPEAEDGGEKK